MRQGGEQVGIHEALTQELGELPHTAGLCFPSASWGGSEYQALEPWLTSPDPTVLQVLHSATFFLRLGLKKIIIPRKLKHFIEFRILNFKTINV